MRNIIFATLLTFAPTLALAANDTPAATSQNPIVQQLYSQGGQIAVDNAQIAADNMQIQALQKEVSDLTAQLNESHNTAQPKHK